MPTSEARKLANQRNAENSTGPKTEAGKAVSRRNAIKHGRTGKGIALPDEDATAVEAAFDRHFAEMRPTTQAGVGIVFRVALGNLRLDRFSLAESAMLSQRVLDAGHAFDDAQFARLDECKSGLHKNPALQLSILSRFPLGVQWVIDAWEALACALESGKLKNWRQPQFDLFEALSGHSPEFPSYADSTMWNFGAMGDQGALDDPDLPGDTLAEKCHSARRKLIAICDEESARWQSLLEPATAATATARDNAIQAARYDGSKEGLLAKKYEAATTRELSRAYKEFEAVEAAYAAPAPIVETPIPTEDCAALGSFFPEAIEPSDPAEPAVSGSELLPVPMTQSRQIPASETIEAALVANSTVETEAIRRQ